MKKFLLTKIATFRLVTLLSICLGLFAFPAAGVAQSQCKPFANTAAGLGFTQELVASIPGTSITSGYGFDSHGNVYTISLNNQHLYKINLSTTVPGPGGVGQVYPVTDLGPLTYRTGSRTGQTTYGGNFTQYSDGTVYLNSWTGLGVVQVDLETASITSDPIPGAPQGNWGIAVDPQLNSHGHHNIWYQANGIAVIDPVDHRYLGNINIGTDGFAIDQTGNFLFTTGGLTVSKRGVPNPSTPDLPVFTRIGNYGGNPDGMAFGTVGTDQVAISNDAGNGTVTMWKFPNNDFTQRPTPTVIASGPISGEYGDQANVGPDGYFYITYWYGTKFPNCSTNSYASIVRFGPAGRFLPPTHSDNINLTPATDTKNVGTSVVLTATQVTTDLSTNQTVPVANTSVTFTVVGGPDLGQTFTGTTDVNGRVTFTLVNQGGIGDDVVHAQFVDGNRNTQTSNNAVITFIKPLCTTPVFTSCPGNQTANTLSNSCDNTVTYSSSESVTGSPAPTVTYAFTGATSGSGTGNGSGSVFNKGTTTVTLTATNSCGTATCSFTVTVTDNLPPVITTNGDQNVNAEQGKCGASVSVSAGATDNCGVGAPTGVRSDALPLSDPYPVGTTTITWNVTDGNGNPAAPVTQTVTVTDNEKPSITAPAAISVNNDAGICGAVVALGTPATGDNCGVATTTNNAPALFPVGTTTVTWTVTDIHGNSNTATQTVTVTDAENPIVVTKPVTVTLLPNGSVSVTASMVDGGSTDNCGIASTSVSPSIFYCSNIGTNTVTLSVTDIYGHTSTGTAVVTVIGEIPGCSIKSVPTSSVFTGGNPNSLYLGYGAQSTTLQVTPVGASGNGGPNYTYTYSWTGATNLLSSSTSGAPVFTPTAAGSYTFTVTTTNNYGCVTTCSISICVTDIRVPGTNGSKVYVCHLPPGNTANPQTLSISVNAVPAHLGNHTGDKLGSCDQKPCTPVTTATNATQAAGYGVAKDGEANDSEESFTVKVSPNPSTNFFTLKLESKFETPVSIVVMDVSGRVVDAKSKIASNSTIQIGQSYISGKYYAEIIQGTTHKTVQLMKVK